MPILLVPDCPIFWCSLQGRAAPDMFGGHGSQTTLPMLDIIATQVIPRLQVRDVQSLAQTCQQLRNLVITDLPPASWLATASHSFPPGHPMLGINPLQMRRELNRLAAVHHNLLHGRLAWLGEISLEQGPRDELHALALSPSGSLIMRKCNAHLTLQRLDRGDDSLQVCTVWTIAAPDVPQPWGYAVPCIPKMLY